MVTPDEAGNWNYVFKNLPQYDAKGKITYTVTESAVAGYETSVSGYNITNTHKPETLDITGTKINGGTQNISLASNAIPVLGVVTNGS